MLPLLEDLDWFYNTEHFPKFFSELIRTPHGLSLKVEGTDAMDVDVPSPKISEEYRFVSDVYNR